MGRARCAHVAPMQEQPMVGKGDILGGNVLHELHFHLVRGIVTLCYQAETMAHTEDMRIDSHGRLAESYSLNHVGSLTTNAWQVE